MREEKIIESINLISRDYPTMQILNISITDDKNNYRFYFLLFDPDNEEIINKEISIKKGFKFND